MDPRAVIDDALELTIVASFSRLGIIVRSHLFGWTAPVDGALLGRTVLVTGPTSGLGRAATDALAVLGARIVLVGRSATRLAQRRNEVVTAHGADRFPMVVADMSSLASVRAAVTRILETEGRLDVVVDNAGAIFPARLETPDGIEATLATLVVGPYALISGLLPLLQQTGAARVISVTSGGMYSQRLHLDDLRWMSGDYSGSRAYARAKRAQVALMREWSRRFGDTGVTFNAMHPGWADTPGLAESLPGFYRIMRPLLRSPAEGIDTIVWLATDPTPVATGGRLYLDRRSRPFDRLPATRLSAADRRRLWDSIAALAEHV